MKTYYFAADSKEIQQQWMNALSMASIMQLSAIFPSISTKNSSTAPSVTNTAAAATTTNTTIKQLNQTSNVETANKLSNCEKSKTSQLLDEESGGFVSYQAKRLEENNSAIMGINYFDSNYTGGTSLNLYNSVGLPNIYQTEETMYDLNGYISTAPPPKPQRQYYDSMLPYDLSTPSLTDYKIIAPDLINHSYFVDDGQERYFADAGATFLSSYPGYFASELGVYHHHQHQPSAYHLERIPPRPHSADFLERSQDEDIDEECQNAFRKESYYPEASVEPKIMPTRPKSSIERYDYYRPQYFKNPPANDDLSGGLQQQSFADSFDPNKENEVNSKLQLYSQQKPTSNSFLYSYGVTKKPTDAQQHFNGDIATNGVIPVRPPLPQEYSAKIASKIEVKKSSKPSHSDGKDTSYTSDDESKSLWKEKS